MFIGEATETVVYVVHRQHVVLHDRRAVVRAVRQGGRRQTHHHGPRQVQADPVRILLCRVLSGD